MTQVHDSSPRAPGAIVAVRGDGPGGHGTDGAVHAARLVDIGGGKLEPILPICEALIVPVVTREPVTCEICLIRLRPDALVKAARYVRGAVGRWRAPR